MENLLNIVSILALSILGLLFFVAKLKDKVLSSKLEKSRQKDQELLEEQRKVEEEIRKIDESIQEMKKQQKAEKIKRDNMTLKERAEEARKRYGK